MAQDLRGVLAIWHDIQPEHVADVLAWYDREHHFERLGIPGFLNVRRYHAITASPLLFIRYETTSPQVLASPAYLERLNAPTAWTRLSQPAFRNNSRTVCVRAARAGQAEGGAVVTVRLAGASAAEPVPPDLWTDLVAHLLLASGGAAGRAPLPTGAPRGIAGVVGLELWRACHPASSIPTAEKALRGCDDVHVAAALVVHATDAAAADAALDVLKSRLTDVPAKACMGTYALAFSADNSSL